MSAVDGNDDEHATSMSVADGEGLPGTTGTAGLPANCVVQEPQHKHRGLKVRRPQRGFFSRRKLALGIGKRNIQDRREHRKLHYKCLEEMVLSREQAIQSLRRELEMYKKLCMELDEGRVPKPLHLLVPDDDVD